LDSHDADWDIVMVFIVVNIVEVSNVADWNLLVVISDADWNVLVVISDAD
jgi:hypothetical protein